MVVHSGFHRDELLGALPQLLRAFPDRRHDGLVDEVRRRVEVLPVGIDAAELAAAGRAAPADDEPPLVLWNHRWEHDKDPEAFVRALVALDERDVAFRVGLAGERPPTAPAPFEEAAARFGDRIVAFGDLDHDAYRHLLARADVVVSTARHEFFGIAVCEAMAAGACPVLPARLSYPELLGTDELRRSCLYGDDGELVDLLEHVLRHADVRSGLGAAAQQAVQRFDWAEVAPRYDALLEDVAAGAPDQDALSGS